jgi:Predicted membrane protein (DUF2157)
MMSISPNTSPNGQRHWLDDHVQRWVRAGVVSPDQGQAIIRLEAGAASPPPPSAASRLSIISEAVVYGGSALALSGGSFVIVRSWESVPFVARIAVGLVVAVVGFVGGRALHAMHEPGAERLAGFLWLVGAGGVALATGVSVREAGVETPELIAIPTGSMVAFVGAVLWRNRERPLQLLTTVVGLMVASSSTVSYFDGRPWVGGIALWVAALVVGALAATGRLHPQLFTLMLAAVGLLVACAMLSDLSEHLTAPVGLVTAAGVVVAALSLHRTPVLVIGVVGGLIFLQALFSLYFRGPLASAAVALTGLALVAVVLVRSTRSRVE